MVAINVYSETFSERVRTVGFRFTSRPIHIPRASLLYMNREQ